MISHCSHWYMCNSYEDNWCPWKEHYAPSKQPADPSRCKSKYTTPMPETIQWIPPPYPTPSPGKKNTWQLTRKSKILALDCSPTWFSLLLHLLYSPLWNPLFPESQLVQFSHLAVSDSLWPHGLQASLSITNSQSLLKLKSIKSVMSFNHLVLCHPLVLLPSILPRIRVFSNESVLHIRWPKY